MENPVFLTAGVAVEAVCTQLTRQYQGDPEEMVNDVVELLGELCGFGMLTAREGESAAGAVA